ncbi:MAG TPA: L-histidine N(alpha)-methyltransferase [Pontibacter sp.]
MPLHQPTTAQLTQVSQPLSGNGLTSQFLQDVIRGLSQPVKQLSSQYFYDGEGSRLFRKIMHLPEYYLTACEREVFTTHQQTIATQLAAAGPFQLIDLGAGDGLKTKIILRQLLQQKAVVEYVPVDISGDAMVDLSESLQQELPELPVHAVVGDYFSALEWICNTQKGRKVLFFLGSNIGNFSPEDRTAFMQRVSAYMQPGDLLLVGMDLRKDPDIILRAYNDASGVTAAFNLNLLTRINRELGGNIQLGQFRHFPLYDPQQGVMRSYLVSLQEQEIQLEACQQTFRLGAWEAIHTENSYKFTLSQPAELGDTCNLKTAGMFMDKKAYFADVLFTPHLP